MLKLHPPSGLPVFQTGSQAAVPGAKGVAEAAAGVAVEAGEAGAGTGSCADAELVDTCTARVADLVEVTEVDSVD